jgi:hypothetical protein
VVVNIEWKNTKHEDAHRSERRSALINSLTEPTLLEMSGNETTGPSEYFYAPQLPRSVALDNPACDD